MSIQSHQNRKYVQQNCRRWCIPAWIVLRLHSSQNWIFRTLIPDCLHYSSIQMLHYHLFQHGVGGADAQCYLLVSQTSHQMVPQTSHKTLRASESLLRRDRRSSSHHCSGWVSESWELQTKYPQLSWEIPFHDNPSLYFIAESSPPAIYQVKSISSSKDLLEEEGLKLRPQYYDHKDV